MLVHADSEDSDQNGQTQGAHVVLLVLSCCGSIISFVSP